MYSKTVLSVTSVIMFIGVHGAKFDYCKEEFAKSTSNCRMFDFPVRAQSLCAPKLPSNYRMTLQMETIDPRTKKMIRLITNVFEHASKIINYGFCENIGDQRGFTCGTVGFTTGTGDLYTVVEEYEKRLGAETGFSKYRPELRKLASHSDCSIPDGDVSKLAAFAELWKRESCLSEFRSVQDDVADTIYYLPAVQLAAEAGVTSSLGKAIFYDTAVQHGWEEDDGLSLLTIINLTGPKATSSEQEYLERFLVVRRKLLCCYPDDVWPDSADRVSDLMDLARLGDLEFKNTIRLNAYETTITGKEDLFVPCANPPSRPSVPDTGLEPFRNRTPTNEVKSVPGEEFDLPYDALSTGMRTLPTIAFSLLIIATSFGL
ncbi:hypothetical protein K7432_003969 [Basidiobolus ranarum]|uniref:Lysozyme-like protein n=1 Tax=Basidiobolus ranarum TaxID=34480 RepID=A0ABR2WZ09_9FUNG